MKTIYTDMLIEDRRYNAPLDQFASDDKELFQDIYESWIRLSKDLKSINARGINLPEGLSEGLFCLCTGYLRVNGVTLPGVSSSFDCYDDINHRRIQVKACSVLPDLSSFGPNSQFDDLYFMDFSRLDGTFDIYYIPSDFLHDIVLNKRTGSTFRDQQRQGRRPRLSLYNLAIENNISPETFNIFD